MVSSTLDVSGVDTTLLDVDLTTAITHTFPGDLDITLMSPAGTVVTLTTDNADTNDDVFNGTLWDEDADPDGQVPYTTNDGLVTDHAYTNLTLASPLVPEESLRAFVGQDPNGPWTLTISDDTAVESGNLASWTLDITTIPTVPATTGSVTSQATPTAIPDGAVVSSTLDVSGADTYLVDVNLTTAITHTFPGDLDITLMSPADTVVTLTTDNADTNDNVYNGTLWHDGADPDGQVPYTTSTGVTTDHPYFDLTLASPLVPEESFGAFIGEDPNGTWTLTISDDTAVDSGTLASWDLEIVAARCEALPPLPANVSDLVAGASADVTEVDPGAPVQVTGTILNDGPSVPARATSSSRCLWVRRRPSCPPAARPRARAWCATWAASAAASWTSARSRSCSRSPAARWSP